MKTNPGGQLDPKEVMGRDELINELWETLEKQSVIMTAERRIGKTSVMNKMRAEPKNGWIPIFQDLEQYHSAFEFASAVYDAVQTYISVKAKAGSVFTEIIMQLKTVKIGPVEATLKDKKDTSWQTLLDKSIGTLVQEQSFDSYKVVFLWDELPYMLANIRDQEGEKTAMQVLDVLRSLRHEFKDFRMLITGSIGLHHVLSDLKSKGYKNQPVNDMYQVEVQPLNHKNAQKLAETLLSGEGINTSDAIAQEIAAQADNFPFYIHHIVRSLKLRQVTITPETVREVVAEHLSNSNDPWQLRHYEERIENYYGEDNANGVKLILDELATKENAQSAKDLLNAITSQSAELDSPEELRKLLNQLAQDHYLAKDTANKYSFRFSLIKRWWKLERELDDAL